jgi:hypothetical protein
MFYVNTALISGGHFSTEMILNGGYYIVTSVDNNFRADSWETKIRGVLQIPDHALAKNKEKSPIAVETVRSKPLAVQEQLNKQAQKSKPAPPPPSADKKLSLARQGQKHSIGADGNCYVAAPGPKRRRHKSRCKD